MELDRKNKARLIHNLKPRREEQEMQFLKKHLASIVNAALFACLIVCVLMLLGEVKSNKQLMAGVANGFELKGTFAYESSLEHSIYFEQRGAEEGIAWGGRTKKDGYTTGKVSPTEDPNIYLLISDDGELYAVVHLAYSSWNDGTLFVAYDGTTFAPFDKISDVRATYCAE